MIIDPTDARTTTDLCPPDPRLLATLRRCSKPSALPGPCGGVCSELQAAIDEIARLTAAALGVRIAGPVELARPALSTERPCDRVAMACSVCSGSCRK